MGGRRAALVAAAVSTAVALGGAAVAVREAPEPAGTSSSPAVTTRVADRGGERPDPADLPRLGVQFHGTWTHYTRRERAVVLDRIERSGATWVRLDVGWSMLQPKRGSYDREWGVKRVDGVMDQLRRRGLKVLVMFWLTPDWATREDDPVLAQYTPPDRTRDYTEALGWAARRWGDVVDAWEIWNEPNLESFFIGTDPAAYTRILCRAYPVVRRNDPGARVVFGGLMYNDDAWLERAYDAGVGGCFDVMAVHSYQAPADAPPGAADDGEVWSLAHLDAVRATMREHGDRLPVWITEFGWSVHRNETDTEPWRRGVTRKQQAAYGAQALKIMARDFPYVTAAFWYKDAAVASSTDEHQEGYALLDERLRPRPVLRRFGKLYGEG
ncbi:cellulase family glycosylhydrolase [Nocardioides sp. NPDC092400]|uniref:cellulase family glycosylhydrolase n=1 Tax=Nocardioides sp. NPDC092400 TaxID=3155196 RepID=UPI0034164236